MKKKSLFSFIYIGVTILVIVLIMVFGETSVEDIGDALKSFNIWWMLACIGALLLYWLMDGLLLHDITAYMYKREPLHQSIKISLIGLYYCALTPSSTGGQPMQVVYMKRNKIPVGTATCIVCIKFVIYELSLCSIYVVAMLLRGIEYYVNYNQAFWHASYPQVFWLAALGFVVNLVAVFFIILTIVNKRLVLRLGGFIIRGLSKIKIIKKKEKTLENFEKTIDDYHTAASYISRYKLRALGSYLISLLNLGFLFVIPYLIYLALGNSGHSIFDMFMMEAFLFLAVSFFPLPGAVGASETGFVLFFRPFFGEAATVVAMLIWRFLTYYMMLIVGSVLVVLDEVFSIRKAKRQAELNEVNE